MDIDNSLDRLSPQLKSAKKKSGGFQSMNLKPSIFRAIKAKGYNLPTPIQRKVIPLALEGRDLVACSRTGSGKTAAFLIPMLNKLEKHSNVIGARALIISPTRELALQTSSMNKSLSRFTDLVSSVIVGGHGFEGQFESLATNPDIIIATPGRLAQVLSETNLTLKKLEFLVFDEADFLFEMGFAEHINVILEKVNANRQTLLFSATIPEQLSEFSRVKLKDYIFCKLDSEYTLSDEVQLNFILCRSAEKLPTLLYLLIHIIDLKDTSIVFVSTKYHVDLLSMVLQEFGIKNVGIYGKMDQLTRKENLAEFRTQRVRVLLVTDLAARGLDIPFVNNVIHFDHPPKPKIYIHRSGRTARAGRSGCVYSLIRIEEMMFISEISLYIGRKLTYDPKDLFSKEKAVYGRVPGEILSPYMEAMDKLKTDPEFFKGFDVCEKAFKQFLKTRKKTSKASLETSKSMDSNVINPLFEESMGCLNPSEMKKKEELIKEIKNYKPKIAYLELNKIKKNEDMKESEEFLKIINRMKSIELKAHEKKIHKNEEIDENVEIDENEENDDISHEKHSVDIEPIKNVCKEGIRLNKRRMKRLFKENKKIKEIEKNHKKSDFRHPTQYVPNEPDRFAYQKKQDSLENSNKITSEDVNPFLLAESFEDMSKSKKMLWDQRKKKYVKGSLTETGQLKKDKEDKSMTKDKGKKLYKTWSKRHMITFQNEGESEDTNMTSKAKDLFQNRRKQRFLPQKEEKTVTFDKKKFARRKSYGKKEIKTPKQILKARIKKQGMNLKNMEKGKRRKIIFGGGGQNKRKSFHKR